MDFELTILSSGTGSPGQRLNQSALHLRVHKHHILVDCGEGTQHQLGKYGLSYQKIKYVFISHLHADHYTGLIGLINTMNLNHRKTALHVFGPKGIEEIINTQLRISEVELHFPLHFQFIGFKGKKKILDIHNLKVFSFPVKHRIPTSGFLFMEGDQERKIIKEKIEQEQIPVEAFRILKSGKDFKCQNGKEYKYTEYTTPPPAPRSFAYLTDTIYRPSITKYFEKPALLYHEATFDHGHEERAKISWHSTTVQAAMIARKAEAQKLLIGHISNRNDELEALVEEAQVVFENTLAAKEGMKISIPLTK